MKTDELREKYLSLIESKGCERRPSGVFVMEVESGSPAEQAGIEMNPVPPIITHVGGTRVRNPAEFYEAVKNLKGTVDVETDQDTHAEPE